MAFMFRVQLDSPNAEFTSLLLESLGVMAGLQDQHTGMVTYHFSRPDPESRPHHFEFTEVYANEATFWAHSDHPEFIAAYSKAFMPTSKFQSVTYGYGAGLQGKVKEVCDLMLNARYPQSISGFILNTRQWESTSSYSEDAGDGPILVITRIHSKKGKVAEILEQISKLSEELNGGVIVCHASLPEEEKEPNLIEFIELCSTNSHLAAHVGSDKGKEILQSLVQNAESLECHGYGTVVPLTAQLLQDLGLPLVASKTDVGYVLHTKANPAGTS